MKFTEAQLEQVFIELLAQEAYPHHLGESIERSPEEVLIEDDLRRYLNKRYAPNNITIGEIDSIIRDLHSLPSSDLYESNKAFMHRITEGFILKREDSREKDLYIELIDYKGLPTYNRPSEKDLPIVIAEEEADFGKDQNIYKFINQLTIVQYHPEGRIPDGILYINGLPLVVFEFKSAIREEATLHDAYKQLTIRYKRDIPELFKYNAFCVISDGVNNKAGSFFAPYEFYYAWRKIEGLTKEVDGIDSMFTLVQGMLNQKRLRDILRNFIYLPDSSKKDEKIVCRYPQYYAANKLYHNIIAHQKPKGDGKGGTYFGATGCGKSFTMLFLSRLIMKSTHFASPTLVLITDRTDLDDQLSTQFTNAKRYIGDQEIISVKSRKDLRERLQGKNSGGVYLTTIHKFTEDIKLLSDRNNIICISDEAHRSQVNLDLKLRITEDGVKRSYGFAKYLHDSLPNATYVGFTGTPIDATTDVFGEVIDAYTMTESVFDDITVRIVYEGRAARVMLNNQKLEEIEAYYDQCANEGSNEYQIDESKKAVTNMNTILGDPDRLDAVASDFIAHYEKRTEEGTTVAGKALFVCSSRQIAYDLFQRIIKLRPEWNKVKKHLDGLELSEQELKETKPMEMIKMIMTRGKDDPKEMYETLGTKEYRKELDRQFKNKHSNFKIAIVVDMWLTGFDVPFLDTIYIDKPIKQHSLIQTISRVNRKYEGKDKGLVVDYIGIKKQMNLALKKYSNEGKESVEDVERSITVVKDHLDLLARYFHGFDSTAYFSNNAIDQLHTLNRAAEFAQGTKLLETRFMNLTKRLKAAYNICVGSERIDQEEREHIHYYLAIRSIIFKLNKGEAPDTAQMNARVLDMIKEAIKSSGVEEIFKLGEEAEPQIDLFDEAYLEKINKIKLPNTKIKLLQKLLAQAIDRVKEINRIQGINFSQRMELLIQRYNERKETDSFGGEVFEDITDEIADDIIQLYQDLMEEMNSFSEMGIDFEEKAFYDILKAMAHKYEFEYPEEKLLLLSRAVKALVDDTSKYTDWNKRSDIKDQLKVGLILLLAAHDYPPVDKDEVYKGIFEQAENFKRNKG